MNSLKSAHYSLYKMTNDVVLSKLNSYGYSTGNF